MKGLPATALRIAVIVYAASTTVVLIVAIAAAIAFSDGVSAWQDVPFPELPKTLGEAGSILLHNGRILLAAVGAALAVNAPWLSRAGEPLPRGWGWKSTRALCDVVLVLGVARNLLTVGVGLAAYRERMALAILPHGPVELAAFSCGLALYLLARRGPVEWRFWLTLVAGGGLLLGVAALLEVFVVF